MKNASHDLLAYFVFIFRIKSHRQRNYASFKITKLKAGQNFKNETLTEFKEMKIWAGINANKIY